MLDYNLNGSAVDKLDVQISFVDCLRKTVKWYRKLFFHTLDLAIFNSFLLYEVNTEKRSTIVYNLSQKSYKHTVFQFQNQRSTILHWSISSSD